MHEILHTIWSGIVTASRLDQANLVLGVVGVWLMIRRTLWAFPVGLVGVAVQAVLFYRSRLYADATQQAFFFAALAWGWWHWVHDRGAKPELPISVLGWRRRGAMLAIAGLLTAGWALALQRWTDAAAPWRDAFIAVFGILAQVLQARKNLENWPLWAVVNSVAIAAYWSMVGAYTAFLYALYLMLAFVGWSQWRRAMRVEADGGLRAAATAHAS